jgi:hypothetical protein
VLAHRPPQCGAVVDFDSDEGWSAPPRS